MGLARNHLIDSDTGLSACVLRLHIVHVGSLVLVLVVVLRDTTQVRASNRRGSKRRSTPQAVTLRKGQIVGAITPCGTANDAAVIGDAGASILRDNGRSVAAVSAALSTSSTRNIGTERSSGSEHGHARRVRRLRAKRLDVGRNVTKSIVGAIKAGVEATGSS